MKGVTEAEIRERLAEWNTSIGEAIRQLNDAADDAARRAEARKRYQELYDRRGAFMVEDRTGFVWLDLRK